MFKYIVTNNGIESILHYPAEGAPFILGASLNEGINIVPELTASIPLINTTEINLYKSLIKVVNIKDNSIVFDGRIIKKVDAMDADGQFTREITAEGLLGILNDTYVRNYNDKKTVAGTLNYLLWINNTTNTDYSFNVGVCEFTDEEEIAFEVNFETTLSAIFKMCEIVGAEIYARKNTNGIIYIDILKRLGHDTNIAVTMGENMLSITKEYDSTEIASRVIPIGNGDNNNIITISDLNNNKDYLEDQTALNQFGIIEKTVENLDIKDAQTLLLWGQQQLNIYNKAKLILDCKMVDLSYIVGDIPLLHLGDSIYIRNNVLGINQLIRVIEKQVNLFEAWNPSIKLASRNYCLTDQIIDLKTKTKAISKNATGSMQNSEVRIKDNITSTNSIKTVAIVNGIIKGATLTVNLNQYIYYTSTGVGYGTYPSNVIIKINGTQVKTMTGGAVQTVTVDVTNQLVQGINTIEITSTTNGNIDGVLMIKDYII